MESEFEDSEQELQHLKRVSRIKHVILQKYLPSWAVILGSRNPDLAYFDCFAGPGRYEFEQERVEGSPLIAVQSAIEFLKSRPQHRLRIHLVEEDNAQLTNLKKGLSALQPYPPNLAVEVHRADSRQFVPRLLRTVELVPSFFLVDPYGHPLPIVVLNEILQRPRSELLINLMWFRINMDLGNPAVAGNVDELTGSTDWREQEFMQLKGYARESAFLNFFCSHLNAKYIFRFKIRYDPEDRTGGKRTKYYLLHASNHVRAVLLMKEVMWPLGDEEGTFDYSGESQGILISQSPREQELKDILLRDFHGQELSFDKIRELTWNLPFIEKHYRSVLLDMAERGEATLTRVSSKKSGLKREDRIRFR